MGSSRKRSTGLPKSTHRFIDSEFVESEDAAEELEEGRRDLRYVSVRVLGTYRA
jgi:hypothetical protein